MSHLRRKWYCEMGLGIISRYSLDRHHDVECTRNISEACPGGWRGIHDRPGLSLRIRRIETVDDRGQSTCFEFDASRVCLPRDARGPFPLCSNQPHRAPSLSPPNVSLPSQRLQRYSYDPSSDPPRSFSVALYMAPLSPFLRGLMRTRGKRWRE
jgi:hypothetical protein